MDGMKSYAFFFLVKPKAQLAEVHLKYKSKQHLYIFVYILGLGYGCYEIV